MLVVHKYGGTSVGSPERIRNVAEKVLSYKRKGADVVVVVSAMSGETDRLLKLAGSRSRFPDDREADVLLSTGEQVTSALLAITIKEMGEDAVSMLGLSDQDRHRLCFRQGQDRGHRRGEDPGGPQERPGRSGPRLSGHRRGGQYYDAGPRRLRYDRRGHGGSS